MITLKKPQDLQARKNDPQDLRKTKKNTIFTRSETPRLCPKRRLYYPQGSHSVGCKLARERAKTSKKHQKKGDGEARSAERPSLPR